MIRQNCAQSCCATTPAAIAFGVAAFVVLYGTMLFMASRWPALQPYGDTPILAAMGLACSMNFARNRTLHCGMTGPVFILAAVVAALAEARIWDVAIPVIWGVVLAAVAVAFTIEWRVARRHRAPNS